MSLSLESIGEIDTDVKSIQVLIAHEADFMRAYLKRILSSCGLEQIHQVCNGVEALEALTDSEYHLLLLDLQLPLLNGLELLDLIRSDPRYEKLQVIVVTGISQKRYVRQAIALGVADYILKPFQREFVERRLAAAIKRVRRADRAKRDAIHPSKTRILVADCDRNFCDTVQSVLSGGNAVRSAQTAAQLLTLALKWAPHYIFLHPSLPGAKMNFIVPKVREVGRGKAKIYLIHDEPVTREERHPHAEGWIEKTFVPAQLEKAFVRIISSGEDPLSDAKGWFKLLKPEVISAVRQVFGMMTGIEPKLLPSTVSEGKDLSVAMDLTGQDRNFRLQVVLTSSRALAEELCAVMMGVEQKEISEEFIKAGLSEVTNVVAGRIKNCCEKRHGTDFTTGLPEFNTGPKPPQPDCSFSDKFCFEWKSFEHFSLTLSGGAVTDVSN